MTKALFLVKFQVPVITSNGGGSTATVNVSAGATAVTTVTAIPGLPSVSYSISGGADAALFTINSISGVLAFIDPSVAGNYEVIIQAANSSGFDTQTITAAVSDVYVAQAVHFDGNTWLKSVGALSGVSDSPLGLLSVWIKAADWFNWAGGGDGLFFYGPNYGDVNWQGTTAGNQWRLNLYDWAGIGGYSATSNAGFSTSAWVQILACWDMNHPAGQKLFQLYLSDILFTNYAVADAHNAFDCDYSHGVWQAAGATDSDPSGPGPIGDQADFYFAPGQYLDLSVEANRRKFISASGKPVYLGADGSTPTGIAPAMFFTGNAASFTTNKGTGGAFALTGTLTNATTSPSN